MFGGMAREDAGMDHQLVPADGTCAYERPVLVVHGSASEATAAQILGTTFDQTIPAGTPITGILGRLSF